MSLLHLKTVKSVIVKCQIATGKCNLYFSFRCVSYSSLYDLFIFGYFDIICIWLSPVIMHCKWYTTGDMYIHYLMNRLWHSVSCASLRYHRSPSPIVVTPVLTLTNSMRFLFISRNAMRTLGWRHCMLFCLLITWFYTIKKNKWKVRDWKVRNNRFCQCIAVWSHFLRLKITHTIKVKFYP